MPERPKRRKNNKNKRKNKNNRPDANKNNSETKLDNSESCNTQNDNEEDCPESEVTETKEIKVEILQPSKDNENTASSTSSNVVNLNGDLNNNSNQIVHDVLSLPVEKCFDSVPDTVDTQVYVVEAPEQSHQSKAKLNSKVKSKSLDDDDATKIIEITEDDVVEPGDEHALALIDNQNFVVTHVESDVEWESAADLGVDVTKPQEVATGTLSITTIPLNVAQCDQTKSLTPDEEKSLRSYLNTLNLATQPEGLSSIEMKTEIEEIINQEIKQRLRKKASADDFFLHRLGPPRMLDVIDEEGSGSGSSMTSRRQSYLSDKRSDVEDLDDDVFEDNKNKLTKQKKMMSIAVHKKSYGQLVPQECVLVGAKIKEPEVSEARGDWAMKTVEKMTGAEVVYLTDTSSSTSSLHEIDDEDDGVDTDASVRIITPTIEVTDTENFLKKTFISNAENNKQNTVIENQVTVQDKINQNVKNGNVSEKTNEDLKVKNVNTEHIIKVELKDKQHENIENTVPIKASTERIIEVTQNSQAKNKSHTLIHDESSNNENIVKITHDQDVIEKHLPPIGNTTGTKKEHFVNIEYEKRSQENESNLEKDSSQNSHEIVVLSTDDIKTNLYVKDIDESITKDDNKTQTKLNKYDLESKVIKCEFNDAINNLIKEVTSESEESNENLKETFSRQDSSSSVDSSQCTAKYNPNYSSLNDISNMTHDETSVNTKMNSEQSSLSASHVKDVFECVTGTTAQSKANTDDDTKIPLKLRDLCVRNIATLPYGKKILEELASVSERLQHIALYGTSSKTVDTKQRNVESMPHYRLPDVSSIETISIPTKIKDPVPPPIKPRRSSLRKTSQEDEHWTGIPTKSEPVYVCLSPSQKMLMEKTNTVITKDDASHLVDMHRKFVDRRGYNEQYKNEKEREDNEVDTTPIIPFKSQTGSRLLALIRDPTLTNTINSLNQRINSSEKLQKKQTTTTFAKSNHDRFPSRDFSFKPIPPPRPKKYSSSFYESDESSDFTDSSIRSMKSERKFFHYSTGNLNKEIESDISSIQNMHRYFTDTRDEMSDYKCPRRPSLPKDLCEQQMEYIRQKEKEVEAEIQRLEALKSNIPQMQRQGPRAPLVSEKEIISEKIRDPNNYSTSRKKDVVMSSHGSETRKAKLSAFSSSQEELLREKMYSEYVSQMAEREERKQHKVIKITNNPASTNHITISKSMPTLDVLDGKVNNRIEKEFISRARERWDKLGIKDPETEDERESTNNVYKEPKVIEHKIKVIEGGEEKDVKKLPSHLQEFVRFTVKDSEQSRSSSGESNSGPASPHLVIMCAVIILVIAVGKYFLRLLRNK